MEQFQQVEESVKALWERAKQAGELIARLREEKQAMQTENASLQQQVAQLRKELAAKDQQVQQAAATVAGSMNAAKLSNGDREQLTAKVKELLARIDAYL